MTQRASRFDLLRARLEMDEPAEEAKALLREGEALDDAVNEVIAEALMKAAPAMELSSSSNDAMDFHLPDALDAEVTEEAQTPMMSAVTRYRVELRAEGELRRVRLHDFEYLEINSEDVTGASKKLQLARARAAAANLPELLVTAEGRFVSLSRTESMLESLAAMGAELSPERLRAIEPLLAKFWFAWFASWRGMPLGASPSEGVLPAVRHLLGRKRLSVEAQGSRGPAPQLGPRYQLFQLGSRLGAAKHSEALREAALVHLADADNETTQALFDEAREAELQLIAAFEPDSGLPAVVGRVSRGEAGPATGLAHECSETQLWSFEWDL